ncbi:LysR family transcriptional regulator [Prauserella marina]|uniref:DNA-binding transcriptional regulator, LysR family n=1 Tax=Prauserella marina TaxID=530584 RepID=A0A222VTC9_9PSEU|nr:LysR family transcriptional regulator [Prauserella marina]ASR37195.1 LysR family transcriptional regulator [Prauserella marina]PWV72509.1 DNA-binding transcriptional LysR family regulator [Prauserella marina]SDD78343.1 DNA-binding transcriptional regulator, LysR family [Prauserella marina]
MLNLERLRVLHAVSTTGSVVGAAKTLHVTTSAVSQQMARLEREVGQRLVERNGRGVRLTETGRLLAGEAAELMARVERVEAGLAAHRGAVAGRLDVAAFATAARGLFPGVLRELRSRYPELRVSLTEREPHEAIPALVRSQLDLVVVQDWVGDALSVPKGLSRVPLLHDRLDVALPAGHPLAGRDTVGLGELADEEWIAWSEGEICHDWLVRTLSHAGTRPRFAHTASEHSTQLALVEAGLGIAVIPRLGRESGSGSVRFAAIEPAPVRQVFALYRDSTAAKPAIAATVDELVRQAGEGASPRRPGG